MNLLLELGCEEIPARLMPGFLDDLRLKTTEKLARERLTFEQVVTLGTARRLTLFVAGLAGQQPDVTEELKGPSAEAAFDPSGKPTPAALGFARSHQIDLKQLTVRTLNNRNYVFAKVVRHGQKTEKLLSTLLPEIISSLHQPLAMRWGKLDFKFIRPIHSIVALYGKKVIKFELAGIKSGNTTFAHRYYPSPSGRGGKVKGQRVRAAELLPYKKQLLKLGVVVDQEERKLLIKAQVEAAAKKAGAVALVDEGLLNEVTFLVENPVVYVGTFRKEFLDIPQEVLITSMKKNQKYFPLLEPRSSFAGSNLRPMFAVVTDGCKNKTVVAGNEKVLTARLTDARFFFEEDQKQPLKLRLPDLAKVAFFEKLGNMRQKAERIGQLGEWLGRRLGLEANDLKVVHRIAELCKADLTTKMVFEFPELQGVMGREYARTSGEEGAVADGILEHYLPRFAEDKLPGSLTGTVVALADRFDSLVGSFAAGYIPTGSEDPYGLRRAVQGIIRIVGEKKLDLLLDETIEHAYKGYEALLPGNPNLSQLKKDILEFFVGRLRPILVDQGVRHDIAEAALVNFNDILDTLAKAEVLNRLVVEPWFPGVIASADRLSRIAGKAPRDQVLEHDLVEPEEQELYALYLKVNWEVNERIKKEEWTAAARELSRLTDPIEAFFDKVLVMHKDERLKLNRLALLKSLEKLYLAVADFRQIVIEGKK
ncbi:MAG: glycine--tRNA ligase subunit beta [Candidatus Margulisiibacteriota bacterium]